MTTLSHHSTHDKRPDTVGEPWNKFFIVLLKSS